MQTKLSTIPAILVIAALTAPGVLAQGAPAQKLGIIDMQSALISTKDGQKAVADLRGKFGPKDQALQKRQQDLQAKQDQYRRTQNTISDEAKAALEAEIASLNRAFQRDSQDAKEEMDEEQQRMVTELGGKIMQVLTKFAGDNHYTLIFDVSGQPSNILFASNTIDITREIIALYDKETAGSAPAPAASSVSRPSVPSGAIAPGKPRVTPPPAPASK